MYNIEANQTVYYSQEATYQYKAKNSCNQLLTLTIARDGNDFWVCFFITSKRKKGYQKLQQTGKDGLSSLLWAKNCVINWISNYRERYKGCRLCISHDDKRRAEVYKRSLSSIGFEESKDIYKYLFLKL